MLQVEPQLQELHILFLKNNFIMEQTFINVGDKTYKCKIAKSEEDKNKD